MQHKITICPIPQVTTGMWQGWCFNDGCDWYSEGVYDIVWKSAVRHRGYSDI